MTRVSYISIKRRGSMINIKPHLPYCQPQLHMMHSVFTCKWVMSCINYFLMEEMVLHNIIRLSHGGITIISNVEKMSLQKFRLY